MRSEVTVKEAALLLQMHPASVRKLLLSGTLAGRRLDGDGQWVVDINSLAVYLHDTRRPFMSAWNRKPNTTEATK